MMRKDVFETKTATLHLRLKGWSGVSVDDWWPTFRDVIKQSERERESDIQIYVYIQNWPFAHLGHPSAE